MNPLHGVPVDFATEEWIRQVMAGIPSQPLSPLNIKIRCPDCGRSMQNGIAGLCCPVCKLNTIRPIR